MELQRKDPALFYQTQVLKEMSPVKKLACASQLYCTAYTLKKTWLAHQHPDWPEERVDAEVRRIFLYART